MSVLLLQPRTSAEPAYPIALASIAPLLQERGVDCVGGDLNFDTLDAIIEGARGASWVICPVLQHNALEVREILRRLGAARSVRTALIGAYPTLDPDSALRTTGAEIAVTENPEECVAALVVAPWPPSKGEMPPGCAGLVNGRLQRGPPTRDTPLVDLPLPDRTLFPLARYSRAVRTVQRPAASIRTSRGCGRGCPYCPVDALRPRGFDGRPPAQIVEEMRQLAREHGVRSIHVEDDHFVVDRERVELLCEQLLQTPVPAAWELLNGVRPDHVDALLLGKMGAAGCARIVLSFEHLRPVGAQPEEDGVGYAFDRAAAAVKAARAAGMRVGGYFIVGLPGRSRRDTLGSLRRAFALGLDYAKFTPLCFVAGSPYARERHVLERRCLPGVTSRLLCRAAELTFFAQPRIGAALLTELAGNPALARTMLRRAWELLRHGGPVPMRDPM